MTGIARNGGTNMKPRQAAIISAIVCIFAVTNVGAVPILTVFTDRTAWEAAVGGSFTEENFDGFTGVSYEFAPVDVGDFDVSVSGSTFGFIFHNIGPSSVAAVNDVNGTGQINAATGDTGGTSLLFDFPITAFGANWAGISDSRITSFDIAGTILAIPNLNGGFFGFVSDIAFSGPLLFLSSGGPDGFGIDNVVYSAVAVAEPITLALLGIGLAGIGLARRRKKV